MVKSYREVYRRALVSKIVENATELGKAKVYVLKPEIQDEELIKSVIIDSIEKEPKLALVILQPKESKTYVEISLGKEAQKAIDAREIAKQIAQKVAFKAGGKRDHVTGVTEANIETVEKVVKEIINAIAKQ